MHKIDWIQFDLKMECESSSTVSLFILSGVSMELYWWFTSSLEAVPVPVLSWCPRQGCYIKTGAS